jgi:hypothetical protein
MNKLDTAITSFRSDSIDPSFRSEDQDRCAMLADALEEIRDVIYPNAQMVEQADRSPTETEEPATFEPWDCVRAKPGSHLAQYTEDAELVLGHHLTKIDPPAPRFTFGDRVRVEWGEIDHIFLGYDHCGTHADVIGHEKNIHNIPIALISAAPLDTDAD